MGLIRTTITRRKLLDGTTKLYPNIVHTDRINTEALLGYMVEHSQISRPVALNAVYAFRNLIETFTMNGHTVKIPQIGTFSLSCHTKGVETLKEATPKNCQPRFRFRFTPTRALKAQTRSVGFRSLLDDEVQDATTTTTSSTGGNG